MNLTTHALPVLEIKDLAFAYPNQGKESNSGPLIDIPNWKIAPQQKMFLYGPSGCGKSTLLNLMSGILQPSQGAIELLGQPFSSCKAYIRDNIRARHLGVVFQQFNLIPYLSVFENVRLARYCAGQNSQNLETKANQMFDQLALPTSCLHQRADTLSVGQQQRVAIARALINDPELLIADEPTSALDEETTERFMQLLLSACDEHKCALVFVSHDRRLAEHFEWKIAMSQLNLSAGNLKSGAIN